MASQVIIYVIFREGNLEDDMIQWKKQAYISRELFGLACNQYIEYIDTVYSSLFKKYSNWSKHKVSCIALCVAKKQPILQLALNNSLLLLVLTSPGTI